ncbi:hypothetical protein [Streptacidiphilus rugosus]|uniref:hypothetical protein n=1 Tax=Streptacidiphilus rugosus TaxID=405783 RepID=UPI000562BCF0|nr:hypothetical protein [Streptacidiphilus rugosus]
MRRANSTRASKRLAAAVTTAAVALVGPAVTGAATASAAPQGTTVHVKMTNAGFRLPEEVRAGFVTFSVSTKDANGHELQGLQLHKGVTIARIVADIRKAVSNNPSEAAAGIRAVERDATVVGGAAVEPSTVVDATIPLTRGTYYFFDFSQFFVPNAPAPTFHRLEVNCAFRGTTPWHRAEIDQVETRKGPRFEGPSNLDLDAPILVRNKADEIHEAMFQRVNPGVTNAKLTAFFAAVAAGKNPGFNPFAESASRGLAAMSPGREQVLSFHPKSGRYALLCFIPDDRSGIPHAFLGMHEVVRL